jgi:hypothetical protein
LYTLGVDQSKKPQPYSWTSILTLHDAVELFLLLTAEYLGISEKSLQELKFSKYWEIINPKQKERSKKELTQRISMEKLNEVRIAFKHHGTEPHLDAINSAKVNVFNFLDENSNNVFGIEFSEISLVDLVGLETARSSLKTAIKQKTSDKESAIDGIAIAFNQLVDDYVDRKRDSYGRSMFDFIDVGGWDSIDGSDKRLATVKDAFRDLAYGLEQFNETVKVIVLGFDYRKFLHFEVLTARQIERLNKTYAMRRLERKIEGDLTEEDVQFCIDFVIECAVILKENDFEFTPKKHPTIHDFM